MIPINLVNLSVGSPIMVELKNGETYNGTLKNSDVWMNLHLIEAICTDSNGSRFWRMKECFLRGNTIKFIRLPDGSMEKARDAAQKKNQRRPPSHTSNSVQKKTNVPAGKKRTN